MSVEICQHRGGTGRCRRFLPGKTFVGLDMNDIATSFKVDREMIAYVNSNWFPSGVTISFGVSGHDPGFAPLSPFFGIGYDGEWIKQEYKVKLPASCPQPTFSLTSGPNGDADWSKVVRDMQATITLRVKPPIPTRPGNWVGLKMTCPASPAVRPVKGR